MPEYTGFIELKKVFNTLHGPKGCPWDKKQTKSSIIPDLKEEVREFVSAVRKNNVHHMKEELGDILLHVMFQAKMASKAGDFDIEDVIETLTKKLKRRHPHVFGDTKVKSIRQVIANWHRIKAEEKRPHKARLKR
jgi:MazG family protein